MSIGDWFIIVISVIFLLMMIAGGCYGLCNPTFTNYDEEIWNNHQEEFLNVHRRSEMKVRNKQLFLGTCVTDKSLFGLYLKAANEAGLEKQSLSSFEGHDVKVLGYDSDGLLFFSCDPYEKDTGKVLKEQDIKDMCLILPQDQEKELDRILKWARSALDFKYMAFDKDGDIHFFKKQPRQSEFYDSWLVNSKADFVFSIKQGFKTSFDFEKYWLQSVTENVEYVYALCYSDEFEDLESTLSKFEPSADDVRLKFTRGIRRRLDFNEVVSPALLVSLFNKQVSLRFSETSQNVLSEVSDTQKDELSKLFCNWVNKNRLYNGIYVVENIETVFYNKQTKEITLA